MHRSYFFVFEIYIKFLEKLIDLFEEAFKFKEIAMNLTNVLGITSNPRGFAVYITRRDF